MLFPCNRPFAASDRCPQGSGATGAMLSLQGVTTRQKRPRPVCPLCRASFRTRQLGGGYRNRTGLHGFAIRCVTSPPTRQPSRWDTLRGTLCRAQGRGTVPVALSRNGLIAEANSGRLMLLQKVVIHLDCFDPVANHSTGGSLRFLRKWAALSEGGTGLPQTSIRRKSGNKAADCSAFFCYGWVPPPVRPVEFS